MIVDRCPIFLDTGGTITSATSSLFCAYPEHFVPPISFLLGLVCAGSGEVEWGTEKQNKEPGFFVAELDSMRSIDGIKGDITLRAA